MSNYITVREYAKQKGVTERTVYRWLTTGDILVKKIKGILHVKVGSESERGDDLILTSSVSE
ncbi:hypothetical protein ES702_05242 [subsurface metagenome]